MSPSPVEALVDVVKGSVLTLSLYLAYITLPLVGIIGGIMAPLPVIIYSLKGRLSHGVLIVAVSALGVWSYAGSGAALIYLLQGGFLALSLSYFLGSGMSVSRTILCTMAICTGFALTLAIGYSLFTGVNLHEEIVRGIDASTQQAADLYGKSGVAGDDLAALKLAMGQVRQILSETYPALLIVMLGAVSGVNTLLVRRFGLRWGLPQYDSEFAVFKLPELLVWFLIAAGFSLFFDNEIVRITSVNVLMVAAVLYFMQGMAVIVSFFKKYAVPSAARIVFYLLVGMQPYIVLAVAVFGLFDIWGNFRAPRQKNL